MKRLYIVIFLLCSALLALAWYLAHFKGFLPCPLCTIQQMLLGVMAALMLTAIVRTPRRWGHRVYGVLVLLSASLGLAAAGRQLWLEARPLSAVDNCIPGLGTLVEYFSWPRVWEVVTQHSAQCAETQAHLFGLSLPMWSLGAFAMLACLGGYLALRPADSPD